MPKPTERPVLTQAQVRKLFAYHDDGYLVWRVALNKSTKVGSKAGTKNANDKGYLRIKINGWEYAVHRLVYLWHTGKNPPIVDHIDHCRTNNKIDNLRAATTGQNSWNALLRNDAQLKVKGVTYRAGKNKPYIAELRVNGKRVLHLSCFTLEEAERAVREARRVHHRGFYSDGD